MKLFISSFADFIRSLSGYTPPGLVLGIASAFVAQKAYLSSWVHEFCGALLMILFTFSAGKWIGVNSLPLAWTSHAFGVVAADYIGGGPHVNPAVSLAMWSLGKCSYTEMYVRIAAEMAGGLVAFPLYRYVSDKLDWQPLGGPEFDSTNDQEAVEAFLSEFAATFLLLVAIFVLNFELHFGRYHYWIKQPLTALTIRYLIEVFPAAGPAINPMLGTTWAVFAAEGGTATGSFPDDAVHYFVYWIAPFAAALCASFCYVVYAGGEYFTHKLPFGPIKDIGGDSGAGGAEPSAPPAPSGAAKKKKTTKKEE